MAFASRASRPCLVGARALPTLNCVYKQQLNALTALTLRGYATAVEKTAKRPNNGRPTIPKIPPKTFIKVKKDFLSAPADPLRSYVDTHQNIDFSAPATGLFGFPELRNQQTFEEHNLEVRRECDELLEKIDSLSGKALLEAVDTLNAKISVMQLKCSLVKSFATQELASVADRINEMYNVLQHRLFDKDGLYSKIAAIETAGLTDEEKNFVASLLLRLKKAGGALEGDSKIEFRDTMTEFEDAVSNVVDSVENASSHKLVHPSKLYELPRALYNKTVDKSREKKRRIATLSYATHTKPVLQYVANPTVREPLYKAARELLTDKVLPAIGEAAELGTTVATNTGFKTYAEMVNAQEAVGSLEQVTEMLTGLASKLQSFTETEIARLQKSYSALGQSGRLFIGVDPQNVNPWDRLYMEEMHREADVRKYRVGDVNGFFPISRCLNGLSQLSQSLFGMELRPVQLAVGESWNPEHIKKFELFNTASQSVVGTLYMDLYIRDEKPLVPESSTHVVRYGYQSEVPSAVLSFNFRENLLSYPSMLSHNELRTLLREYGNALTVLMAKSNFYDLLSGAKGSAPASSKILHNLLGAYLERFAFDEGFLGSFAGHYWTNTKVFSEYIDDIIKVGRTEAVHNTLERVIFALTDLKINNSSASEKQPMSQLETLEQTYLQQPFNTTLPLVAEFKHFDGSYFTTLLTSAAAAQLAQQQQDARKIGELFVSQLFNPLTHSVKKPSEILKQLLNGQPLSTAPLLNELTAMYTADDSAAAVETSTTESA